MVMRSPPTRETVRRKGLAGLPTIAHILPMPRVVLVAFEGAQGLDVMGPAEVFAAAERHLETPGYEVVVASIGGGAIRATSGVTVITRELPRVRPRATDTVLVVGGDDRAM